METLVVIAADNGSQSRPHSKCLVVTLHQCFKYVFFFLSFKALKAEKVRLVACGRNHTIVYTCKSLMYITFSKNNLDEILLLLLLKKLKREHACVFP